jgi:iron uptake system EfeUOB component EfeO/EfeM
VLSPGILVEISRLDRLTAPAAIAHILLRKASMLSVRPFAAPTGGGTTPLGEVVAQYRVYVAGKLDELGTNVGRLRAATEDQDRPTAKRRWLDAQLTWQQIGAAYGSFGPAGTAISGLANGLPGGVADPGFTGLHRIEWGLYNGEQWSKLHNLATRLVTDVASLKANFDKLAIVPRSSRTRCGIICPARTTTAPGWPTR